MNPCCVYCGKERDGYPICLNCGNEAECSAAPISEPAEPFPYRRKPDRPRRRRETKHKDQMIVLGVIPHPTGSRFGPIVTRKPKHHHRCPLCARAPLLPRRDICRGNDKCRCRGCEQAREAEAPRYKARIKELSRM